MCHDSHKKRYMQKAKNMTVESMQSQSRTQTLPRMANGMKLAFLGSSITDGWTVNMSLSAVIPCLPFRFAKPPSFQK